MVPNGWKNQSPTSLFKLFSGFAFKSTDAQESGAKWLKIANVGIGEIKWGADSFLPEHYLLEHKKFALSKGDIVVALTRPTLGNKLKVARLTKESDTSLLNQRVAKIVCKDDADSEFVFQLLRSDEFAYRINVGLLGTDPPNLSVKVLEDFTVGCPPLPEQQKIAEILSTWDNAISTTEKLIANSKQQKKALMQQLLTGKKRLVNPETGKTFEGEWEKTKLGDLSEKITKGTTPSTNGFQFQEQGISFVKVESILKSGKFDASKFAYIDESCHKAFKRSQLEEGDILFSIAGALGRTAIVTKNILPANTNQALSIVRLKKNSTSLEFVVHYLNSSATGATIKKLTAQAAQPNLSLKDVGNLPIRLPKTEEQQKIASVLTAADKEIELLETKLAHLKQEKKALMQQLLTGKRRVKIAA